MTVSEMLYTLIGSLKNLFVKTEPEREDQNPDSIYALEKLVCAINVACICDMCQPTLYGRLSCLYSHQKFNLNQNFDVNKCGYNVYQPLPLNAYASAKPELMHIARTIIEYFDRPWGYMNERQLGARGSLLKWISRRDDVSHLRDEKDPEKIIPATKMRKLWKWIKELFFSNDIGDAIFEWVQEEGVIMGSVGLYHNTFGKTVMGIVMHPDNTADDLGKYTVLAILATLIHETVHDFLARYGCESCRTQKYNKMGDYYGRPWHLIAAKLEEVVPSLLGIPVKLGWEVGLMDKNGAEVRYLLSRHDLVTFRLSSVRLASEETIDTSELLARTRALYGYKPKKMVRGIAYRANSLINKERLYVRIPDIRDDEC